jgi:hypothetical protein
VPNFSLPTAQNHETVSMKKTKNIRTTYSFVDLPANDMNPVAYPFDTQLYSFDVEKSEASSTKQYFECLATQSAMISSCRRIIDFSQFGKK